MPETPAQDPARRLAARLEAELATSVSAAVAVFARHLQQRHGPTVCAVVFYGSCLRKRTAEGVLDFYVIVDDYHAAHASRAAALANAILPPNVLYCELPHEGETLRAKYAVLSVRHYQRGSSLRSADCRVWARFSQPAALAWVRDEAARQTVVEGATRSVLTFVSRALAMLPGDARSFTSEALFQTGFRETYRAELRAERDETIRQIHDACPQRYRAVAADALCVLAARDELDFRETPAGFEVVSPPGRLRRAARSWRMRRPLAKLLAVAGLFKTAFTFGDWVPYVVWKAERHTAVRIELTERQRRHPLIFGWPVILRLLREGTYR